MLLKKNISLLIIVIIISSCASKHPNYKSASEIDAVVIDAKTSNKKFMPLEHYNPLFVRVNFIFLLDENGEGNFNGKDKEDNESLDRVFTKANKLIDNLKDAKDSTCYTGFDFLSSSKIQFQFKKMYIKDTFARNYLNAKGYSERRRNIGLLTPSKNWYLKDLDHNINDTIQKKGINVYNTMNVPAYEDLVENHSEKGYNTTQGVAISQFPSYSNYTRSSQLHYPNWYTKRLWIEQFYCVKNKTSWKNGQRAFELAYRGLSHELGHSLGLYHSNEYHRTNKCFKALMSQSGRSPRNYIQPTEIGKMHKAMMTSNVIQFVTDDSNYGVPKTIYENENWNFKKLRFYQDIIVNEGQVLILNGTVIFPENASITLEKNALLVLNNATLKTVKNNNFINIIKKKHAKIIKY